MAKLITTQPAFTVLVANSKGGSDPSRGRNPVVLRTGFRQQHFHEHLSIAGETKAFETPGQTTYHGLLTTNYNSPQITITVEDNDFTYPAHICLGVYKFTSGEDYDVGGDTDDTATNIAAIIEATNGYSAESDGSDVIITVDANPNVNVTLFKAVYDGSIQNFTLSNTSGYLSDAEPKIGTIEILEVGE